MNNQALLKSLDSCALTHYDNVLISSDVRELQMKIQGNVEFYYRGEMDINGRQLKLIDYLGLLVSKPINMRWCIQYISVSRVVS